MSQETGLVDIFFFSLGILETLHLRDEIILFLNCINTADAWWGNLEIESRVRNRGLARERRAGVAGAGGDPWIHQAWQD